jgi:hypothetical protein
MQRSTTPVDEHIASLPEGIRGDFAALDAELSAVMPTEERVLWEGKMWGGTDQRVVGYGAYRQQNRSGQAVDWFIVGLAAQKNHISLYVSAVEDGQYLVKRYADRLGKVKVGSAYVTFRRLSDLDLSAVREMAGRARELMSAG